METERSDGKKRQCKERKAQWVQCDNPECQKWRRIDYEADVNGLKNENWVCKMNEGISDCKLQLLFRSGVFARFVMHE